GPRRKRSGKPRNATPFPSIGSPGSACSTPISTSRTENTPKFEVRVALGTPRKGEALMSAIRITILSALGIAIVGFAGIHQASPAAAHGEATCHDALGSG